MATNLSNTSNMANPANPASTRPIVDQSVVTAVTAAVSTRTATVSARISSLTIGNDGDYRTADFLLVELRHARKLAETVHDCLNAK